MKAFSASGSLASRQLEIIGVVGDVALDVYGAPTMVVYRPHRQFADDRNWALTQVVATERSTEELLGAVRTRGGPTRSGAGRAPAGNDGGGRGPRHRVGNDSRSC